MMRTYRKNPDSFKRCQEERSSKAFGSMLSENALSSVSLREILKVKGNTEETVDCAGRTN